MPFNDFKNSPKSYCSTHQVYISNSNNAAGAVVAAAAQPIPSGNSAMRFNPTGTRIHLTRNMTRQPLPGLVQQAQIALHVGAKIRRDYDVVSLGTAPDNGFRYLPYRQNHVTYMAIDGNASFVITGPLTGCTVAVGRDANRGLWLFHANENGANGDAARASQQLMTRWAAGQLGIPAANLQWCIMTQHYAGMALVFGHNLSGGIWKFYVHDNNLSASGVTTNTTKFAEL